MVTNFTNSHCFAVLPMGLSRSITAAYGHAVPIDPHDYTNIIAMFGGFDGITVPISWGRLPDIS
jgi:hypothetical protein